MLFFIVALIVIAGYEGYQFFKKKQWKEIVILLLVCACIVYLACLVGLPGEFSIASELFAGYKLH